MSNLSGAKSGAPDADLQEILNSWTTLPQPVKIGIMAMVKAARNP